MYRNGYEQYKMQAVNTMTQGEMLLLLYDELIKRLTRAQMALEEENYASFEAAVQRSKDIIHYLDNSLDMSYPISHELHRMYEFFLYETSRLEAGRNISVIQELKPLVRELRDAFEEAGKTSDVV